MFDIYTVTEEYESAPHNFDAFIIHIFNRVITWQELNFVCLTRSQQVFGAFREIGDVINDGSLVGEMNFTVDPMAMRGRAAAPVCLSYPQFSLLRLYSGVAAVTINIFGGIFTSFYGEKHLTFLRIRLLLFKNPSVSIVFYSSSSSTFYYINSSKLLFCLTKTWWSSSPSMFSSVPIFHFSSSFGYINFSFTN